MKLSIIIPAYNEEGTIFKILNKVKRANSIGLEKEIIIVNDGSTDKTGSQISKFKSQNPSLQVGTIVHKKNQGKGAAIQSGIKHASGDILLIQDADLEYDPKHYPELLRPIISRKAEVVYGSRLKEMSFSLFGKNPTPLPFHYLGNKLLSFLTNYLFSTKITDMETGYKAMTKKVYKKLHLTSKGFELEPEITVKILKMGYKILEIPITTKPRSYQEGKKITWKDGFIALKTLFRLKFL